MTETTEIIPYVLTGGVSFASSYGAVWAHLKFHQWRLNEQKELLVDTAKLVTLMDKRMAILESRGQENGK